VRLANEDNGVVHDHFMAREIAVNNSPGRRGRGIWTEQAGVSKDLLALGEELGVAKHDSG